MHSEHRRYLLLVLPSFSSLISSLVLSIGIIFLAIWERLQSVPFLSQALQQIQDQVSKIVESESLQKDSLGVVIDSQLLNSVIYVLLWVFLGVLVYFVIAIFMVGFDDIKLTIRATSTDIKKKNALVNEFVIRSVFRIFILIIWLIFTIISFQILLPVAVSSAQVGSNFTGFESLHYFLFTVLLVVFSIHLHVVFMRLCLLKLRVFNQADDIILHEN